MFVCSDWRHDSSLDHGLSLLLISKRPDVTLSEPMGIQVHPTGFPSTSPRTINPNPTQHNTIQHKSKKLSFTLLIPRFRTPSFHQLITKPTSYLLTKHPLTHQHPSIRSAATTNPWSTPSFPYPHHLFSVIIYLSLLSPSLPSFGIPLTFLTRSLQKSRIENRESRIPRGEEDDVWG